MVNTLNFSQDDSVYEQLVHGIRYFDIRAAHYPETVEKFWINHDYWRVRPLQEIISDVKKFVMETNEIIFLDFHRFPVGFNDSVHEDFTKFLLKELGFLLAPKSLTVKSTPDDLWKIKKPILLSYADSTMVSKYDLLWPSIMQVSV